MILSGLTDHLLQIFIILSGVLLIPVAHRGDCRFVQAGVFNSFKLGVFNVRHGPN